jgi:hypothetical protein
MTCHAKHGAQMTCHAKHGAQTGSVPWQGEECPPTHIHPSKPSPGTALPPRGAGTPAGCTAECCPSSRAAARGWVWVGGWVGGDVGNCKGVASYLGCKACTPTPNDTPRPLPGRPHLCEQEDPTRCAQLVGHGKVSGKLISAGDAAVQGEQIPRACYAEGHALQRVRVGWG